MSDTAQYTIGAEVACDEGPCGTLSRVVIDPVARALTHLVVTPLNERDSQRLVPIDLAEATNNAQDIRLACSEAEFRALEPAEETAFLPGRGDQLGYGPDQLISWPYYGLGVGAMGLGSTGLITAPGAEPWKMTYDRVPQGEVEVRRGQRVVAADGEVGRVKGLVIDPQDHGVTHVLLEEGHLWGKKVVGIPIRSVTRVSSSGIEVRLTKRELSELPPVPFGETPH